MAETADSVTLRRVDFELLLDALEDADDQAALAAAARLPPAVRKEVKPWARTVGELASLPR